MARVHIKSFSLGSFSSPELLYVFLQNAGKDFVKDKHSKIVPEDHLHCTDGLHVHHKPTGLGNIEFTLPWLHS